MDTADPKLTNIKPVLCGYIREAQYKLDPSRVPDEDAVHDIRVLLKKSRAALKLLKVITGVELFKREYGSLREAGRIMSSWRETSVLRKLLKDLKKNHPGIFTGLSGNEKIDARLKRPDPVTVPDEGMKKDIESIISLLHKSEYRLRFVAMNQEHQITLLKSLVTTWNLVSSAYLTARNYPNDTTIHELRKKTKDLMFQLFFFRALNPGPVKSLEKKLDSLGQYLGKYNDLSVLVRTLEYKYRPLSTPGPVDELVLIIRAEQDRYLRKIWPPAGRLFYPGKKIEYILDLKSG
jgi:CHAD domain-containing protein